MEKPPDQPQHQTDDVHARRLDDLHRDILAMQTTLHRMQTMYFALNTEMSHLLEQFDDNAVSNIVLLSMYTTIIRMYNMLEGYILSCVHLSALGHQDFHVYWEGEQQLFGLYVQWIDEFIDDVHRKNPTASRFPRI